MALASLKPTTRTISILISGVEYNTVLDTVSIRSNAPEIEETVFSTENTGGTYTMGTERLTIGLGGPLFAGGAAANPFMPIASWQGKTFVATFNTSNVVTATVNVQSPGLDARAGAAARSGATFMSTGLFSISWPST